MHREVTTRLRVTVAVLAVAAASLVPAVAAQAAPAGTTTTMTRTSGAPAVKTRPVKPAQRAAWADRCVKATARDIGVGDSGTYVRRVQCLLNEAMTGPDISEDGSFGQNTATAVRRFQTCANALGAGLVVDGRVGTRTAPHLEWWAVSSNYYIC